MSIPAATIILLSLTAASGCALAVGIWLIERWSRRSSDRWWREFSSGASGSQCCSDQGMPLRVRTRSPVASNHATAPTSGKTLPTRTPEE